MLAIEHSNLVGASRVIYWGMKIAKPAGIRTLKLPLWEMFDAS